MITNLRIEFDRLNDFQVLAHMDLDGDDLAICAIAAQLIDDAESANEFRAMCLSIVQRYLAKISGADVISVMGDQ